MTDITANPEPAAAIPENENPAKACRFYKKGFCGFGEKCLYGHFKPKRGFSSLDNCPFYKKASCKFATKCWYQHSRPKYRGFPAADPIDTFIVVGPRDDDSFLKKSSALISPIAEIKTRNPMKPPNKDKSHYCYHYEQIGRCKYGDKCWYSHSGPCGNALDKSVPEQEPEPELQPDPDYTKMCADFALAECEFGDECKYVHGDECRFCELALLHPSDEKQREEHLEACERFLREDMETAFAIMHSKDKYCIICLHDVWNSETPYTKQIFGIQDLCNHYFCYGCIRKWRTMKARKKQSKTCPSCRKESAVLVPSQHWFGSMEEKRQIIQDYLEAAIQKPCKFFERGKCNVADCYYLHSQFDQPVVEVQDNGDWADVPPLEVQDNGDWADVPPLQVQLDAENSAEGTVDEGTNVTQPDSEVCEDSSPENKNKEDLLLQSMDGQADPSNLLTEVDSDIRQADIADDNQQNITQDAQG